MLISVAWNASAMLLASGAASVVSTVGSAAGAASAAEDVWGPTTLARKGLGGSEEAVVYVSRELARRGWDVAGR